MVLLTIPCVCTVGGVLWGICWQVTHKAEDHVLLCADGGTQQFRSSVVLQHSHALENTPTMMHTYWTCTLLAPIVAMGVIGTYHAPSAQKTAEEGGGRGHGILLSSLCHSNQHCILPCVVQLSFGNFSVTITIICNIIMVITVIFSVLLTVSNWVACVDNINESLSCMNWVCWTCSSDKIHVWHICLVQNMLLVQHICSSFDAATTIMACMPICCAIWIQETYNATTAHTITL